MKRRGAAKGTGSGYRNLRAFPKDPVVHAQAGRGIKQPQRMPIIPVFKRGGKDMPVKEVSEDAQMDEWHKQQGFTKVGGHWEKGTKAALGEGMQEVSQITAKEDKFKPVEKVAAKKSLLSIGWQEGKKFLKKRAEEKQEKYIDELRDVDHPAVKKRDKLEAEVAKIEERIAANVGDEDDNFDKLADAKAKLEEAEDEIKNLDLTTFTDGQLKALAVRETDSGGFFDTGSSNKYESELLRRVRYRKELDKKVRDAARENKEEPLFDF